jgi:phosphoglycolate phosphatase
MLFVPAAMAFDLDGTLVDSVADLAASVNHTRSYFGLEALPLDVVRTYVGDGAAMLLRRSLSTLGDRLEPVFEEAVTTFRTHYGAHCLDRTRPYPGVLETLAALSDLPLVVVSNKPQPFCDRVVEGLGLDRYVRGVVGARPGVPVKPAPDMLRIGFDAVHVDPAGAWMIGDSPNDIRGGRAAGCATIAATYGLVPIDRLAPEHPDVLLHRFCDLLDLRDGARAATS